MMDNLRTAANSVVLKIIFGIIIVSFILTGVSGYLIGGGKNYAAKVNGQEIGRGQFENAVASERNRMQQQLGDQFSELAAMQPADGRFAALLDHIRSHLDERLDVDALAEKACMSPRHFSRRFTAEVGVSPARAVERLRVEAAAALLESSGDSVQAVARRCGFGDPERMRRAFVKLLGVPPSARRRATG